MSDGAPGGLIDFSGAFEALTGNVPFPWQARLFHEFFTKGTVPSSCSLPTGLGKTSVMAIWLIALARGESKLPRRLVYVVNRWTVVDQATREAERLRENLRRPELADLSNRLWGLSAVSSPPPDSSPLAISTLRGQFADNGEWRADPARPAIIVGTVDMIGSRLLFSGYRTGSWQLARHAGLIGHDALIVHDEAHLESVFQGLLRWAETRQTRDGSPRPLRVMAMSATGREDGGRAVLALGDSDLRNEVVRRRFSEVRKALHLHPLDPKASRLTDELVKLAWEHEGESVRVIVYVRRPEDAKKVRDVLLGRLPKPSRGAHPDDRVALLTGTVRGYERQLLLAHPAVHGLLHSHDAQGQRIAPSQTTWLVATSAGEVGADFDADHLVCDLAPMDAMIQRFGRVNRRGGEGRNSRVDVVVNRPEKRKDRAGKERMLSPFDQACLAAAGLLEKLPVMPSSGDENTPASTPKTASPAVLSDLVERHPNEYADACSPQPAPVTPHDVVLDAWALTSIQDDWPLAHDVHPYLHGLDDPEPDTYVAWRAELDGLPVIADPALAAGLVGELMRMSLRHYPLRPLELLRDRPRRVAELLAALGRFHPERWAVRIHQHSVTPQRLGDFCGDDKQLERLLRYETVVLPPSVGGLDRAGMLEVPSPKTESPEPNLDVADCGVVEDGMTASPTRRRVLLRRDAVDEWRHTALTAPPPDDGPSGDEAQGTFPKWTIARDHAARTLGMRCVARV